MYDLFELIIEASLWSRDYSTLDTHPQHTRLWFQWMLISFVWLYMFKWDVYTQILVDQTQKVFWVFYLFLKVILYFRVLCFCSKCIFVFFFKNWFRGCLARSSQLRASREKGLREINFFILSHRNSRYCIATTLWPTATREMLFG